MNNRTRKIHSIVGSWKGGKHSLFRNWASGAAHYYITPSLLFKWESKKIPFPSRVPVGKRTKVRRGGAWRGKHCLIFLSYHTLASGQRDTK